LQGGISLEYKADTSRIPPAEVSEAMAGLKDVIERRVNIFGVSEPRIQTKKVGGENRLVVDLAGVTSARPSRLSVRRLIWNFAPFAPERIWLPQLSLISFPPR